MIDPSRAPPLFHRTHRWTIQHCFARAISFFETSWSPRPKKEFCQKRSRVGVPALTALIAVSHLRADYALWRQAMNPSIKYLVPSALVMLGLFVAPTSATAQDVDTRVRYLETTVARLEDRIRDLTQRVYELESARSQASRTPSSGASAQSAAPSRPKYTNRDNWCQLNRGLTQNQVREILGNPVSRSVMTTLTLWLYGGTGSVTFDRRGGVSGFTGPC